ncbi:TonB-dependent receptor [Yeosuana marina]|uniref:SusC/RagA family TonB-linked outer membrane protein n=1 Tax=Yeosuana marina TaxID=1565536 RepID=UPI0030C89740
MKKLFIFKKSLSLLSKINNKVGLLIMFMLLFFFSMQASTLHFNETKANLDLTGVLFEKFNEFNQLTITGTVIDENGVPLSGANILIKGTSKGAQADFDGNFTLDLNSGDDILIVSYVGFLTKEVKVNGQSKLTITMQQDAASLDEVVVVGYGTQKKSDVTGSVVSIGVKDLQERPSINMLEKMQGKASGVDIVQSSGLPGAIPSVRIRGNRSFSASNEPLYVVDGIPLEGGINDINPNDIKSVEILKDASSTSIYGSRGANGVILVTTNRGSATKSSVSYNSFYGFTKISRMVDMMNAEEFAEYRREAYRATGSYDDDEHLFETVQLENLNNGISYDYPNLIFSQGYKTDHQLSFSGGNDKTQYAFSAGYYDERGTIKNMYYKRYTTRLNLDHKFTDWFKIGTSTLLAKSINDVGSSSAIESALLNSPLGEAFDLETGEPVFLPTTDGQLSNPLFDLDSNNYTDEYKINRVFSSAFAEINLFKDFSYRLNFGIDSRDQRRGRFRGSFTDANLGGASDALVENTNKFTYTLENIFKYKKEFNSDNHLDITVMQSNQSFSQENYGIAVDNLPYESQKFYNLDTGSNVLGVESQLEEWKLASFMGRLNYDYGGKYLLQATVRADGSSRLSDGKKWGYFPSAAFGWKILNEPWMKDVSWISNLKLRTSYGVTGNTGISPYQTQGALAQTVYDWDGAPAYGYALNNIPNPNLKWESTATIDAGIDFGFLNGRISGAIDYYNAKTSDLLMLRQIPGTSGYTSTLENVGSTANKGIEVSLSAKLFENPKGVNWSADLNWYKNKEEILELYNGKVDDVGSNWFIGHPISTFYDYEKIGIWQTDEETLANSYGFSPGEIKLKDQDNNGVIDSDDRIIRGSSVPEWSMGITNRVEYKGFDFSAFVFIRKGSTIYSRFHDEFNSLAGRYNNLDVDYWTPSNPTNAYPRPNQNQNYPRYGSSNNYFDGSFIKIRNLTLGYTMPEQLTDILKMSKMRFYVSGDNLFMFTKYKGWDPESSSGVLYYDVPSSKTILFGINLTF